jgi:hypothetical protein
MKFAASKTVKACEALKHKANRSLGLRGGIVKESLRPLSSPGLQSSSKQRPEYFAPLLQAGPSPLSSPTRSRQSSLGAEGEPHLFGFARRTLANLLLPSTASNSTTVSPYWFPEARAKSDQDSLFSNDEESEDQLTSDQASTASTIPGVSLDIEEEHCSYRRVPGLSVELGLSEEIWEKLVFDSQPGSPTCQTAMPALPPQPSQLQPPPFAVKPTFNRTPSLVSLWMGPTTIKRSPRVTKRPLNSSEPKRQPHS